MEITPNQWETDQSPRTICHAANSGSCAWVRLPARSSLLPTVAIAIAIFIRRKGGGVLRDKIDIFTGWFFFRFGQGFFVMLLGDKHVKRGDNEQSENRPDRHATNQHKTDRISRGRAGARDKCQRKMTGDCRDARHHNRPQANPRCLRDRRELTQTLPLQFVGELHNQDSVLRNETDERDQSYLRVDVERRRPTIGEKFSERHLEKHKDARAEKRQWD